MIQRRLSVRLSPTGRRGIPGRMSPSRPADLIPVLEAAGLIDRSLTTVRAWVRAGSVTGYRETEAPNGRLLVSRAEILSYAVSSGLSIEPGRRPSPDAPPSEASPSPTAAPPDRYFDAVLEAHRSAVAALEARCADLRHDVQDWKDRATAAEAEAAALRELLRAEQGRSLWSRLLGTSKVSALPDG